MRAWTPWVTRNNKQPAGMVRTPRVDKNGLRKGTWTPEEDWRLIAYVARYSHWNWRQLPRFAGLARSGKSCRLRWLNYLRPNIRRGNFTQEEDETIVRLVHHLGYRWSAIASWLPGRTDNEIKNYWRTNLQKRFQQNSTAHQEAQVSNSRDHSLIEPTPNNIIGPFQSLPPTSQSTVTLSPSSEFFTATNLITATASNKNLVLENEFAFLDAFKEPMSEFFWLDDTAIGPIMPNKNIIDPFQILPSTSQSIDSCPTSIPSSWSELSIITDHTTVANNNNLVPEDEFDFQDALIERPMSGIFLLDDSPIDPLPNSMMDPFQILASSQSTNCCPTSTHPSSSEFSIATNNNITVVSDKNLIPEDEFAFVNSYEEPMIGSFSLDYSLVEPMPNCPNNITCPLQSLPTTSQSPYSCPFQSSRELFVSAHDENVLVEEEFAPLEAYGEQLLFGSIRG